MKRLFCFIFSLILFISCSVSKYNISEKITQKKQVSQELNVPKKNNFLIKPSEYKHKKNLLEKAVKISFTKPNNFKANLTSRLSTKIVKNDLKKLNNPIDRVDLIKNINRSDIEIKQPNKKGKGAYILKLIGVSLLLLITGLDVFLAIFSIAFDGFYGVSLIFLFSSVILTFLSISAVKKLKEKYPKKETDSDNNQSSNTFLKIALKTLGIISASFILMAILFFAIIL